VNGQRFLGMFAKESLEARSSVDALAQVR